MNIAASSLKLKEALISRLNEKAKNTNIVSKIH